MRQVLDVCLYGTFAMCRAVAQGMIDRRYGRIINLSSRAYLGNPGQANYSAAKAGVIGLTKSIAKELGRHGITVKRDRAGVDRDRDGSVASEVRRHCRSSNRRERRSAAWGSRRRGGSSRVPRISRGRVRLRRRAPCVRRPVWVSSNVEASGTAHRRLLSDRDGPGEAAIRPEHLAGDVAHARTAEKDQRPTLF